MVAKKVLRRWFLTAGALQLFGCGNFISNSSGLREEGGSKQQVVLFVSGGFDSCESDYMSAIRNRLKAIIKSVPGIEMAEIKACFSGEKIALVNRFKNSVRHRITFHQGGRDWSYNRLLIEGIRNRFNLDGKVAIDQMNLLGSAQERIYIVVGHSFGGTAAAYTADYILREDPDAKVLTLTIDAINPDECAGGQLILRSSGQFLGTNGAGCRTTPKSLLVVRENLLTKGIGWVNAYQTAYPNLQSKPILNIEPERLSGNNRDFLVPFPITSSHTRNGHTWIKEPSLRANQEYLGHYEAMVSNLLQLGFIPAIYY